MEQWKKGRVFDGLPICGEILHSATCTDIRELLKKFNFKSVKTLHLHILILDFLHLK